MTSPPTGTITFLFTDIEGSTSMWERENATPRPPRARVRRIEEPVAVVGGRVLQRRR
jgi:class 3 adenylate cyclase